MAKAPGRHKLDEMARIDERRRLPIGAEMAREAPGAAVMAPRGGVHFRVFAPKSQKVSVWQPGDRGAVPLHPEEGGYFSGHVSEAGAGTRYYYELEPGGRRCPDPATRYQPEGPHGPSQVVDPGEFRWSDSAWTGCALSGQVAYELHVGTFTPEGTWAAATRELSELSALGITLIELMPVSEFPGRFGWGYDGVNFFAPSHLYGTPDDMRAFVDVAHRHGIGVILDVVYNHVGPDGNYLPNFYPDLFTDRYLTDWGDAIDFDGERSGPVRELIIENAGYWIDEFHMDGLRLDATQNIYDASSDHILAALTRRARAAAQAGRRKILLFAENEPQDARLVRQPMRGGLGLDAMWNDDFHHSAMVAATGRNEAYYRDYLGTPQEMIDSVKWGFLYQGQRYLWEHKRRGTSSLDLLPEQFVTFLQNHDQVANSGHGLRRHQLTSPGRYRALTALLLLGPGTPMLFQGQEFGAGSPFLYFADHRPDLARLVRAGRAESLKQFRSLATQEMQAHLSDPESPRTFAACKLDFSERQSQKGTYLMHRDLLRLRREDATFSAQKKGALDGAVLGDEALCLRFFGQPPFGDRLLVFNLGRDLPLLAASSPLLAPPDGAVWEVLWSSEDPLYGGTGTPEMDTFNGWRIPGHAAVVLRPRCCRPDEHPTWKEMQTTP